MENSIIGQVSAKPLYSLYNGLVQNLRTDSTVVYIPSFQRQVNQWDLETKQKFIGSLIYSGIPLTQPILLGKIVEDERLWLLDGLQRLSTVLDFVDCKFKITDPDTGEELSFADLDDKIQKKLRNTEVTVNTLNNIRDQERAYEIFLKANNGVPLNLFQKKEGV
jgi:hypothetical protein